VTVILAATASRSFDWINGAAPRYALVPTLSRMAETVTKLGTSVTGNV
jgi:hypothetical protein